MREFNVLQILAIILYPIVLPMEWVLSTVATITSSYGTAIIVLSLLVFLILRPLRRIAERQQEKEATVQRLMAEPVRQAKEKYRGEERFNEIERIYREFDYHPIKSMRSTMVFVVQIPFLLSALLLLIDQPELRGVSFLFIGDLGSPDGLLRAPFGQVLGFEHINVLPVVLLGLSLIESFLVQRGDSAAGKVRASIIGIVIFVIIYPLPSGMVLYWACNNLWSLINAILGEPPPVAVPLRKGGGGA